MDIKNSKYIDRETVKKLKYGEELYVSTERGWTLAYFVETYTYVGTFFIACRTPIYNDEIIGYTLSKVRLPDIKNIGLFSVL